MALTGYLHPDYAHSLAEFGEPIELPRSKGWLLKRPIAESGFSDAMGPYPLFACADWNALEADLAELSGIVSVSLVADPFGGAPDELLARCFPDRCVDFKAHFVADYAGEGPKISKHHRYYARKAMAALSIDVLQGEEAAAAIDEWTAIYENLAERHALTGIKRFSPSAFAQQLRLPGTVLVRAQNCGETVGAHMWFVQNEIAYSHLAAASEDGYRLMAPYALYAGAIDHFRGRVQALELGGGAGADPAADDGLTRFKRGWASRTVPVKFCGRIVDRDAYAALAGAAGPAASPYFPVYRAGELTG